MNKKQLFPMLAMAMMLPLQSLNADPIPLDFQVMMDNPINNQGSMLG